MIIDEKTINKNIQDALSVIADNVCYTLGALSEAQFENLGELVKNTIFVA